MECLETFSVSSIDEELPKEIQQNAINALETGRVLYLPQLAFTLSHEESAFLSPATVAPDSKNISYDIRNDQIRGTSLQHEEAFQLKEMVKRYAFFSRHLIERLLPRYLPHITQARTSFRPVEAQGRTMSYRKDDTRLHVDAFPSNPVKGKRILRVFSNVNPSGKPRVWRIGEPFAQVAEKMIPRISQPFPGMAHLMRALGMTKDLRTPYDHYMLHIHDAMKRDKDYQKAVNQKEVRFPPGSTWIVYTDQVSHAAMEGQYLFEQTFYLPVNALQDPLSSPLRVLERALHKKLV